MPTQMTPESYPHYFDILSSEAEHFTEVRRYLIVAELLRLDWTIDRCSC